MWQFLVGVIAAYIIPQKGGETLKYKYLSLLGVFLIILNILYIPKFIPSASIISIGVFNNY